MTGKPIKLMEAQAIEVDEEVLGSQFRRSALHIGVNNFWN
jgi:hypothetical protein